MKQQIKCPHCNEIFPIEDSLKHEAEEYRKKLQIEEKEKSTLRQKEFEDSYKLKIEKQNKAHETELHQPLSYLSLQVRIDPLENTFLNIPLLVLLGFHLFFQQGID